ncbi:hypothetical protein [Stella sp.]|uniref:glycosyltransferase family protein n=1 Tax=Stella sp. TaxID=2912054 RepID=UPI0035AEFC66
MTLLPNGQPLVDRIPADASLVVHAGSGTELEAAFARINPDVVWLPWNASGSLRPGCAGAVVIEGDLPDDTAVAPVIERAMELLADGGMLIIDLASPDFHELVAARAAGRPIPPGSHRPETVIEIARRGGGTLAALSVLEADEDGARQFAERHPDAVAGLGLRPDMQAPRLATRRFLVEIVRGALPEPIYVFARMRDASVGANGAMAEVRVSRPLRFLSGIPNVRLWLDHDPTPLRVPTRPRGIFVYQRPILRRPAAIDLLRELFRRQYVVVMEFDDHPSYWPEIARHDYLTFAGAHAVQTSTEPLAQALRPHNPYVGVFRNDVAELPPPRPPRPEPDAARPLRIFYGSLNRADSMRPLTDAINRLIRESRVPIHVSVITDERFHAQLRTTRKDFHPMVSHARHREMVAEADIVLLPLADTEFNRCKSDLSFVEAAARGAVVLASPVVYGPTVMDGVTGMLFTTPEEFAAKLTLLVEDGPFRQRIATNAYRYVRSQRMQKDGFRLRWLWYQSLLDRKEELDRAVRERVPELRDV